MRQRIMTALPLLMVLAAATSAQDAGAVMKQIDGIEAALRIISGLTIGTPESDRLRWDDTNRASSRWRDTFAPMYATATAAADKNPDLLAAIRAHQAKTRQCVEILDWSARQTPDNLRDDSRSCQNDLIEKRAMIEIAIDAQR